MKRILLFVALFSATASWSQDVLPMLDFNNLMKSFENGIYRSIGLQPVREFKAGDNVVGYYNFRNNLMVHNGGNPEQLANVEADYRVSDFLLTWNIATTLNLWDDGEQRTLTYQVGQYVVTDSLVVFQDLRYNTVSTYYNGKVYPLITSSIELSMPEFVGENILAFKDNGNFYKVFWRGKIYELDVWHKPYVFHGGTDMVAFNDPINGTFAIFENGQFLDVENFHVNEYKVGNGLVAYENQNGDLLMYQKGEIVQLSNFGASTWEVKDNVVYWVENGLAFAYIDGKRIEVAKYEPKEFALKNSTLAFRNLMGGVSAVQDGKIIEITNQLDAPFEIHGNSVLVELFNKSYIVLQNGRKYQQ